MMAAWSGRSDQTRRRRGDLAVLRPTPVVGDAVEVMAGEGDFDLIFSDAQGGKWEGLETTVAALRPGGHLLVDDMNPPSFVDSHHEEKTSEVRARILGHPELVSVPMVWSSGLILSTRLRST